MYTSTIMLVNLKKIIPYMFKMLVDYVKNKDTIYSLLRITDACRIGVVSGKAIFGRPLEEYWTKKLQEEASNKTDEC